MKNQPKIDQETSKNRWKIHPKSILEASWGPLGPLEGVLVSLGASWKFRGGVLGASWKPLGPSWSEKGGQHGSNLAPKTEPKSFKNRSQNRSIFECLLEVDFKRILMDFGSKMEPSWNPNGIQNPSQLRTTIFWKNIVFPAEKQWFWRFWGSKLGAKIHQKSIKKRS